MPKRKPPPSEAEKRLVARIQRNQFIRAIGHNPNAPNCHWADEFAEGKEHCAPCDKLDRMCGPQLFGKFRPLRRW